MNSGQPCLVWFAKTPSTPMVHEAMSAYSAGEAHAVSVGLRGYFAGPLSFCDVGGGFGYLLAAIMTDRPESSGVVFDLPEVTVQETHHVTRQKGLQARCAHIGGDMFVEIPSADVFLLKHILHDWNDEECLRILSVIRDAAKPNSKLLICEWLVPGPQESHFSKTVDIAMLCVSTGCQRTVEEFRTLLEPTGWSVGQLRTLEGVPLSILECSLTKPAV